MVKLTKEAQEICLGTYSVSKLTSQLQEAPNKQNNKNSGKPKPVQPVFKPNHRQQPNPYVDSVISVGLIIVAIILSRLPNTSQEYLILFAIISVVCIAVYFMCRSIRKYHENQQTTENNSEIHVTSSATGIPPKISRDHTSDNTNDTKNTKNINIKDNNLYNYNSRHPAHVLMEHCGGFDQFYTNLKKCIAASDNKIKMKYDKIQNKQYKDSNYVLFNYFAITLKIWNEYSILCRGLVIDPKNKKIMATPFPKFFNYHEFGPQSIITQNIQQTFENIGKIQSEEKENNAYDNDIKIHEKIDGSLGIMFYCDKDNKWRILTRGSFGSQHALWASEFIEKNVNVDKGFIKGDTYLFEIVNSEMFQETIYYKFKGLMLLAGYNSDGYEYTFEHLTKISNMHQPNSLVFFKIIVK